MCFLFVCFHEDNVHQAQEMVTGTGNSCSSPLRNRRKKKRGKHVTETSDYPSKYSVTSVLPSPLLIDVDVVIVCCAGSTLSLDTCRMKVEINRLATVADSLKTDRRG